MEVADKVESVAWKTLGLIDNQREKLSTCEILEELERILRAELKPLLDAANDVTECVDQIGHTSSVINRLAAELRNWTGEK